MEEVENPSNTVSFELAKFLLEQAEKKCQQKIETAKSLTDRAVNVLQFSIPLSVAVIGLIASGPLRPWLLLYLVSLVFLIVVSFLALSMYENCSVQTGRKFQPLLPDSENQHLQYLLKALQETENDIAANEVNNEERFRLFFWIMCLLKFLIGLAAFYTSMVLLVL